MQEDANQDGKDKKEEDSLIEDEDEFNVEESSKK
jgi:CheY-like chemotaxis protein